MRFERASPLTAGAAGRDAPSTTCTRSRRTRPTRGRARHGRVRRALRRRAVARENVFGVQFHPEKSSRRRAAPAGELQRRLRPRTACARVILYPGDRHPRRQGRAARAGRLRRRRRSTTPTRSSAARAWVEGGARWLHVVDLDGARDGEPANLEHLERIAGELGVPVQFGGGLRSLASIEAALAAGAERVILGTAAYTDVDFLDERSPKHGAARDRVGRRARRARRERRLDAADRDGGRPRRDRAPAAARRQAARLLERSSATGCSTGPDVEEVKRVAEAVRGTFIYSGGIGDARRPQRARGAAAGQPRPA